MKKIMILLVAVFTFSLVGCSENTDVDTIPGITKDTIDNTTDGDLIEPIIFDYLDNVLPTEVAIRFELPFGNQTWFWNGVPVFSPDGNQIFWSRFTSNQDLSEIWYIEKVEGIWSQAQKLIIHGIDGGTGSPIFLDDPNQMYFMNFALTGEQAIYKITKIDGVWSNPIVLDIEILDGYNFNWNFSVAENQDVYFSLSSDYCSKIYYAIYDNETYGPPIPIDTINGDTFNTSSPFVAKDGSFILFASDRPRGIGHHDLYITVKNSNGTYGAPINLGSMINLYEEEINVSISEDGKYLFFTARRGNDVFYSPYWIRKDEVEVFKVK